MVDEGGRQSADLPAEVEMKEMGSMAVGARSSHRHSDSSFASVSSTSSPHHSPSAPLEGAERGSKISSPPGNSEGGNSQSVEESESAVKDCEASAVSAGEARQTHIAGSAHTNHSSPPSQTSHSPSSRDSPFTSSPVPPIAVLAAHKNCHHQLNSDLLHDAIHDNSPHQHGPFLNGARHISHQAVPFSSRDRGERETHSDVDREWIGVRLDEDGMVSRVSEADWRLVHVLQSYEAKIAELKREIVGVRAELSECVREGGRRGSRGMGEEGGVKEEEAATAGGAVLEDNNQVSVWGCV